MGIGDGVKDEESATELPAKSRFRYNSPLVQVALIGLVCFCCPGMFNALSGGGIYNILGPHITLAAGCSTYVLYAGSFLYYNHHQHQAFAITAGALLGIGAGLLWAGEGAIMTAYPPPNRKGTYISLFWSIFNMGGVIGGLIPFLLNYHRNEAASVNDATYIGFMCFMSAGTLLSFAILPPNRVVRDDGTRCTDVNNFFYSYQFNNVNGLLFNLRTRGLNNVFYWGAQMLGSVGIGYILDFSFQSRRMRGFVGIGVVALLGSAVWGGGLANQLLIPMIILLKSWISRTLLLRVPLFCTSVMDYWMPCFKAWFIGS
ncbi:UNC93-like protein 1 [Hibiscus syriacus]|uniref:UNC93-like protein 1 n=1 Tax=Hibiscus syriacus TaxID=106335 RepID=A0A6A2Y3W0_HIBSY|nr:UNC93-like protein 1 [Hibiscus syriacus]